jgi:hypothetical protein
MSTSSGSGRVVFVLIRKDSATRTVLPTIYDDT